MKVRVLSRDSEGWLDTLGEGFIREGVAAISVAATVTAPDLRHDVYRMLLGETARILDIPNGAPTWSVLFGTGPNTKIEQLRGHETFWTRTKPKLVADRELLTRFLVTETVASHAALLRVRDRDDLTGSIHDVYVVESGPLDAGALLAGALEARSADPRMFEVRDKVKTLVRLATPYDCLVVRTWLDLESSIDIIGPVPIINDYARRAGIL